MDECNPHHGGMDLNFSSLHMSNLAKVAMKERRQITRCGAQACYQVLGTKHTIIRATTNNNKVGGEAEGQRGGREEGGTAFCDDQGGERGWTTSKKGGAMRCIGDEG